VEPLVLVDMGVEIWGKLVNMVGFEKLSVFFSNQFESVSTELGARVSGFCSERCETLSVENKT
jgi:hypothetical protein